MFTEPRTFLFFGRSGAGKGTQAKKLVTYLQEIDTERDTLYIETGKLFRDFIEHHNSYVSTRVKQVLEEGGLLPAFLPVWMWANYLVSSFTGEEHLVFDGVGRRAEEAPILSEALGFFNRDGSHLLYINSSREWCKDRLLERGRSDDTPEDIDNRLDWYEENVVPTIEALEKDPNFYLLDINGEQSVDEVHQEILNKVKAL